METIEAWFARQQKSLAMQVKESSMDQSKDWRVVEENGMPHHIGHKSGRFYKVVFLRAFDKFRGMWMDRCMVEFVAEGEGGINAIILLVEHQGRYLVQAKAEPGNATPGHVVLTATVQASYANIAQKLSGAIYFTELYHLDGCVRCVVPQDGGPFYLKRNEICFVRLHEAPAAIPPAFNWATKEEIAAFAKRGLVSEHLMQCLGLTAL